MRRLSLLIYFFVTCVNSQICGAGGAMSTINVSFGYQKYCKETLKSIQSNGAIVLEETEVLGPLNLNGSLQAKESVIHSLRVNGRVELRNCVISNNAEINGALTADSTNFQHELSVATEKVVLRMCSIDSLIIREVTGYSSAQIVDLRGGTRVQGSIVVESGNGEVWVSPGSEISPEQVIGAKVYKK